MQARHWCVCAVCRAVCSLQSAAHYRRLPSADTSQMNLAARLVLLADDVRMQRRTYTTLTTSTFAAFI